MHFFHISRPNLIAFPSAVTQFVCVVIVCVCFGLSVTLGHPEHSERSSEHGDDGQVQAALSSVTQQISLRT